MARPMAASMGRSRGPESSESYLRRLRAGLCEVGVLGPSALPDGPWCHEPSTVVQRWRLERLEGRIGQGRLSSLGVPGEVVERLAEARARAAVLSQGAVQDLVEILEVLPFVGWPEGTGLGPGVQRSEAAGGAG